MFYKIRKNIYSALVVLIIIYFVSLFFTDRNEIKRILFSFNFSTIPAIITLLFLSFYLKYLRWKYYLNKMGISVSSTKSIFIIYISSLTMTLTPGKIGDLIKAYMLKDLENVEIKKTIPSIVAERIIETLSLMFLVVMFLYSFNTNKLILILSILVLVILFILILYSKIRNIIIIKLSNNRYLKKHINNIKLIFDNVSTLFEIRSFTFMILLSIAIWLAEGFVVYLIFIGLRANVDIFWSCFVYYSSVLIGAVSFIPAGLGIVDGSLFYLIKLNGIKTELAIGVPLLIRVFILWLPILLGAISLSIFNRILIKKNRSK